MAIEISVVEAIASTVVLLLGGGGGVHAYKVRKNGNGKPTIAEVKVLLHEHHDECAGKIHDKMNLMALDIAEIKGAVVK